MRPKKKLISLAVKEAQKSTFYFKLGAIGLYKGQVVSKAYNVSSSNPELKYFPSRFSFHAEARACIRAKKVDTIIVVRVNPTGLACSFPCSSCQKIMKKYGVKTVFYIDWLGNIQRLVL